MPSLDSTDGVSVQPETEPLLEEEPPAIAVQEEDLATPDTVGNSTDAVESQIVAATEATPLSLSFTNPTQPVCQIESGAAAVIASGAASDYSCVTELEVNATEIDPSTINIQLAIAVSVSGSWNVQLRSPALQAAEWSDPGMNDATVALDFALSDVGALAVVNGATSVLTIGFDLRVIRVACATSPESISIHSDANVSSPVVAAVTEMNSVAEPLVMTPELGPIPDPTFTFGGSLDFGTIQVTSATTAQPVSTAELVVAVRGLQTSCGNWLLSLRADSEFETPDLRVVAINGQSLLDGACQLSEGCSIDLLEAGPGVPESRIDTVTIQLHVPAGTPPGSLSASIIGKLSRISN